MLDRKSALILAMLHRLRSVGSWGGETHLQKAMFFLNDKRNNPKEFEFVLYKHGPYSFDLHEELSSLFAHFLVEHEHVPPYGPRIRLTDSGNRFLEAHEELLADCIKDINAVAQQFGDMGVAELEKLATALWVKREEPNAVEDELAKKIHEIKPHIPVTEALRAVRSLN
jgi:uncharacterized protein YwgA